MEPSQLPERLDVQLDDDVQLDAETRSLRGGTPYRLTRLSARGFDTVRRLRQGSRPSWTPAVGRLWRVLTDAGMAHPKPQPQSMPVDWVVPVHDGSEAIDSSIPAGAVVVHDAGPHLDRLRMRCAERGWRLVPHAANTGPAAARNTGAAEGVNEVIAFVDAGVELDSDAIGSLSGHFVDPQVGAVAPRVRSAPASGLLGRFEAERSPLDLGPRPSIVRPDARVGHVPSAVLLVRRSAFEAVGGFDGALRFGEDVDLVWRLDAAGWRVRYAPEAGAAHPPRSSWRSLWRQRSGYGSAAAPLDRRHPGAVAPVRLNAWSLATWALLALGRGRVRWLGVGVGVCSTAALVPRLDGAVSNPTHVAVQLGGRGTLLAGRWLGQAVARAWLPIATVVALVARRPGPLAAALVAPPMLEWWERRPEIDPARWVALRIAEDTAYCHGVWSGIRSERSFGAIRPQLTGIPGLTDRTPDTDQK